MAGCSAVVALVIARIVSSSGDEESKLTDTRRRRRAATRFPANASAAKSPPTQFVFDWAESERDGATLEIDGASYFVPKKGPVIQPIDPGSHRVVMRRRGYSTINLMVSLERNNERRIKPAWTPASEYE